MPIPFINPEVKHVGVSHLRNLNANRLRDMNEEEAIVLHDASDQPLAVVIKYATYIRLQRLIASIPAEN